MGSFVNYRLTEFLRGENTGRTYLDHHDPPPKRKGGIQGHWVGEGDLKYDHNYHKHPLQYSHLSLHESLKRFRQGRRTGTATVEAKLVQQMEGIFHEPLFQVLLEVKKACDSLDIKRCMEILLGYGLRNKLQRILE